MKRIMVLLAFCLPVGAIAQESTNFKLEEHVFNAGGNPSTLTPFLRSTNFELSFDAIGDGVVGSGPTSSSFSLDSGFGSAYPPPGEVTNLGFTDIDTLEWAAERSAGDYNLYRNLVSDVSGIGFGNCVQTALTGTTTDDTEHPVSQNGFFYLVTVENRLDVEGTKGWQSDGIERLGTVCP